MSNWQRLDTKIVYQNSYITVHEDNVINPRGHATTYGWIEVPPAVLVVPIDEHGKVVLTKQSRYTTGHPSWELVGGSTDGMEPLDAAKKELEEEAGLHADKWVQLAGEFLPWNGITTERDTIFIARDLHKVKGPKPEADDLIDAIHAYSWAELKSLMKSGELVDGQTIAALALAGLHLGHFS